MDIRHSILILVFTIGLSSCQEIKTNTNSTEAIPQNSSDLEVDHVNIWVENPANTKESLIELGFTAVPDSLSKIHHGQGTAGRYFYFLNSYLELIFVYDPDELIQNNAANKSLDFTARANFTTNGASPFGIALKVKDYAVEKIPFQKVEYHQDWMEENANIYAAKNSKVHLNEPSLFVVYPEIESDQFESFEDLKIIPEEYAIWRSFFKHKNGAQKITAIAITSPDLDATTETMKAVNGMKGLSVKKGSTHLMELFFDHGIQGKSFDLRPELPLIVHL